MPPLEPEEEHSGNAVEAARAMLSRRRWLAGLTFVGALVTVLSIVLFLPDVYRSSATVLIDRQQIPDELVRSTVTSDLEIRLHTISQEILSRSRLESLIERFNLYREQRKVHQCRNPDHGVAQVFFLDQAVCNVCDRDPKQPN